MKRFLKLLVCFALSAGLMISSMPLIIFAMTPYPDMSFLTFEDGPWSGQRYAMKGVKSDGSYYGNYVMTGWRDGSDLGDGYYNIAAPSGSIAYKDVYIFGSSGQISNMTVVSSSPLLELYAIDSNQNVIADLLEDALIVSSDGKYFYGVSVYGEAGICFRTGSITYVTELSSAFNGGSYYETIANNMPIMSGIFDGNSVAVRYPGMALNSVMPLNASYGFSYFYYPSVVFDSSSANVLYDLVYCPDKSVFSSDCVYTFVYKTENLADVWLYLSNGFNSERSNSGGLITTRIDYQDTTFGQIMPRVLCTGINEGCYIYLLSTSSDDIGVLPADPDQDDSSSSPDYSSALGQIGSQLKNVLAAVSDGAQSVVNNITYQTTQITNTITNTVTNMTQQITQGLSDVKQGITDKLQGVQEGITGSIENANKEQMENDQKLHEEQMENDQKLHEEQIKADKENTDQITGGFDNSTMQSDKDRLESSLQEYDEAEQNVLDQVNDSLNDFEFDGGFEEYANTVKVFSDFLQALYESSGGFKVVINLSLMLSIAGIVIGVYRFKEGG